MYIRHNSDIKFFSKGCCVSESRVKRYEFQGIGGSDFFIKNNAFIGCDYTSADGSEISPLSKMEMMVVQTAFYMAHQLNQSMGRNKTYDAETEFVISLKKFAELWRILDDGKKIEDGAFYTTIRRAIKKVDKRKFSYPDLNAKQGTKTEVISGYFGSVKFITSQTNGSEISFSFPKDLIPYLKSYGQFTWYYFENVIKLRDYPNAITMYELFSKYKNKNNRISQSEILINIPINKLRGLLMVGSGYDITDMIRKIVKPAVEKVNSDTSIQVLGYTAIKSGRVIESVEFKLKFEKSDLSFSEAIKMVNDGKPLISDSQIFKYAIALANLREFCDGVKKSDETETAFIERIGNDLKNNQAVLNYYPYLKKCGFVSDKIETKFGGGSVE